MQRCSTGCRLLLITPVLFILLQVALALHHHHFESIHDDKDSLHTFPTSYYPDHVKLDSLARFSAAVKLPDISSLWTRTPDSPKVAITTLITDPPQSRAPPVAPIS